MNDHETTDLTLFVRTSGDDIARWNRRRIVDALIRETSIDVDTAEAISREVERQIISSGIAVLTTSLIRELVDAKLVERGLEQARRMHARVGFPLYDVRELILHQNKENANVPHGPEGTNLVLAEGIKREYALHDVFSQDVVDAHIAGDLHLHGLGYIDRPYSSCQSLEYVKKFGLDLPHFVTVARPARHAEVLLSHMVRFSAILQGHFAAVAEWDAVNVYFAPYLQGLADREMKQIAQMLIYEFSQLTSARGGQSIFTDIHLYWTIPEYLKALPAIGPGGEYTGKPYQDYLPEAQRFARALFEVFQDGDGTGKPFIFPRPLVHITPSFFTAPGHQTFLHLLSQVALEKGNTCFLFDRREIAMPPGVCNAVVPNGKGGPGNAGEPWKMRHAALQNVSLNLPRMGYRAKRSDRALWGIISDGMGLVAKAHRQKRDFIEKLLSYGEAGPLAMLAMARDGEPYLRLSDTACLIGMVGLNELVHIHKGEPLHASDEALSFGLSIVEHILKESDRWSRQDGLRFCLEQTHAETTGYRFARLDLKYFSPEAGRIVRGNLARGEVFYTNSTHMDMSAPIDAWQRVQKEGRFHSLIKGGAITHLWLGETVPAKEDVAAFVIKVYRESENRQIDFSPEFTTCLDCRSLSRGIRETCPDCRSERVEGIARITQYYSRTSGWNKGKLAELKSRYRQMFRGGSSS